MSVHLGRHYVLRCTGCGAAYADDGSLLRCPAEHAPALLRTEYVTTTPSTTESVGACRYRDWLPVRRALPDTAGTVVYRARGLGQEIGVPELWVAFHGHRPGAGGTCPTGSFKDLEASVVLGRRADDDTTLVVASAGNTAAAFAAACSRHGVRCLLVVPESGLLRLRAAGPLRGCVRVVALTGGADYGDAIRFAAAVADLPGFDAEGGVWNVARRDGLGTAMLTAAEAIGDLPAHYVQAVGSGVGALAAYEAASRLDDQRLPALLLCQNEFYAPMRDAWLADQSGQPWVTDRPDAQARAASSSTPELTHHAPPYHVSGGLREALRRCGGSVRTATDRDATTALALFAEFEGVDAERPVGFALAALRAEADKGRIQRTGPVLLNVTGGGRAALLADTEPVRPDLELDRSEVSAPDALTRVQRCCADQPVRGTS